MEVILVSLKINFNHSEYSSEALNSSIVNILNKNILCSIASIRENKSYIHTAYYCYNSQLDLFFISAPETQHIENITDNKSIALAIYDSHQPWDNNKCGMQLFGICKLADGRKLIEGTMLYLKRFTGLRQWIQHPEDFIRGAINSRMYYIKIDWIKLFDEENFGEDNFLTLRL